jgi:hypothetical protein
MKKLLLIIFICLVFTTKVWATTITFQDGVNGYSGTTDNWISNSSADNNYGTLDELDVANNWYSNIFQVFIRFDLSSLTGITSVSSATINLLCYGTASNSYYIQPARLLRNWGELTSTWNKYDGVNSWTSGGADSQGNDRNAFATGSPGPSVGDWISIDVTSDVNDMLVNSTANYGRVLVDLSGVSGDLRQFRSRENATPANRPYITITYTGSGGATGQMTTNSKYWGT